MSMKAFIFLTLAGIFFCQTLKAQIFISENANSYHRWNINAPKDFLLIKKEKGLLIIESLEIALIENLFKEINLGSVNSKYIKSVKRSDQRGYLGIAVEFSDPEIDAFNFYRDQENKYVIDFWKEDTNTPDYNQKISEKKNAEQSETKIAEEEAKAVVSVKKEVLIAPVVEKKKATPIKVDEASVAIPQNDQLRDFRYGAPFVWKYAAQLPTMSPPTDVTAKTVEVFYPINNRDIEKSAKETHIQLAVNMYRKKQYGLMNKSIELFQKKYGESEADYFFEYMKANALLRDNLEKGEIEPVKVAINMLLALYKKSPDPAQKQAIGKYLMSYYYYKNDTVNLLKIAKSYYVESKGSFNYEEIRFVSDLIFYSLAKLKQVDQLNQLLEDTILKKYLAPQRFIAFKTYGLLSLEKEEDLISYYESESKNLSAPIEPVIIFNVAEAYFRTGNYDKAISLFDRYITDFSHTSQASHARIRIALAYDFKGEELGKVSELYKQTIDRSQDNEVQAEARIRYVATNLLRNKKIEEKDLEFEEFLNFKDKEELLKDLNLKHMLWLVRMRIMIVKKDYNSALKYLNALPLESMKPNDRKVFEQDGAEIVYGLMRESYQTANHTEVIRLWDKYKKKYVNKVAQDNFMNFIVAKSYINLGFFDSFDSMTSDLEKFSFLPNLTYPVWLDRHEIPGTKDLIDELNIIKNIKLKNFTKALDIVNKKILANNSHRYYYYRAIIHRELGNTNDSILDIEKFITEKNTDTVLSQDESAKLLEAYTESLFSTKKLKRFEDVSRAIISENSKDDSDYMKKVRERIHYLYLEIQSGKEGLEKYSMLEALIPEFNKKYPESQYRGRIKFLLGKSFLENKKTDLGKEILDQLLKDEKIDNYVKEMARSELTTIKINENSI
jgi:TolA-binding protein